VLNLCCVIAIALVSVRVQREPQTIGPERIL
jgi:hypothetical protein